MDDDATYTVNDLSPAACFALAYAQAVVYGPGSEQGKRFASAQVALHMSAHDKRLALAKGLAELADLGVIECERDGHGDLVPKKLHEERMRPLDSKDRHLVTKDHT